MFADYNVLFLCFNHGALKANPATVRGKFRLNRRESATYRENLVGE